MPTTLGSLRRLVLTPSFADVSFAGRGFPAAAADTVRHLEAIPQAVVCGFEWGIDCPNLGELERRLALAEPALRGFCYEGATMACTVLDAMRAGRGHRTRDLLSGPGRPHLFLTYIGIGFAMARLPRPLWKRVVPDLADVPYHPTMSWLAVDGYGFDRAYFDTGRIVQAQQRLADYPWEGRADYFGRAVDQGIGRALWFIYGARVAAVAAAVRRFASERQADLWAGVGLAATFAGGCSPQDLAALRRDAQEQGAEHAAELAVGGVFAAKARSYAGFVPEYTEAATWALTDLSVAGAAALADEATADQSDPGALPRYGHRRRRIRGHFQAAHAGGGN